MFKYRSDIYKHRYMHVCDICLYVKDCLQKLKKNRADFGMPGYLWAGLNKFDSWTKIHKYSQGCLL